jgi:nitrogen fixation NifU-like protein
MEMEELIERYQRLHNKKKINGVCGCFENDSCGDNITFCLKIKDNKIVDAKFDGTGCVISQITADELADYIKNKNVSIINKIDYAKLKEITNINPSTGRIKCMLASLNALKTIKVNDKRIIKRKEHKKKDIF